MGTQLSLPKKGTEPPSQIFGPCLLWPNGWINQDGTWQGGGPWFRPHCARRGPSSLPKGAEPPQFSAVYCGQTAAWINMPLGTKVGLVPGDFLFDGDQLYPEKKAHPPHPIFGQCLLWPNSLMHEDANWYRSRPWPRPQSIRRGPSSRRKGHSSPLLFGPCLLCLRSPISAIAELSLT